MCKLTITYSLSDQNIIAAICAHITGIVINFPRDIFCTYQKYEGYSKNLIVRRVLTLLYYTYMFICSLNINVYLYEL